MKLYHITKHKYVDNILSKGLCINSGKSGFVKKCNQDRYIRDFGFQPIFLTNNIQFICENMLTKKWIIKNNITIFEIYVDEYDTNLKYNQYYEFIYLKNIEVNHIKIVNINFDKFNLLF